jgi:uncharacterized MnhB-related membrane protein
MIIFINSAFVVLLYVLLRSADIAITAGRRDPLRAIIYGIVAILALVSAVVAVFSLQQS